MALNEDDWKTMDEVVSVYFAYFDRVAGGHMKFPSDGRTRHNVAAHLTLSHFLARGVHIYDRLTQPVEVDQQRRALEELEGRFCTAHCMKDHGCPEG